MKYARLPPPQAPPGALSAGIDWASANHAVCIVDAVGGVVSRFSVAHTAEGLRMLLQRLAWAGVAEVAIERGEREFCLLQWRPDHAPGPDAVRLAAAMWDPRRRVNLRCNTELAADRARDEPALARRCTQLNRPVLILHGAKDPRPVWASDSLAQALPNSRRAVIKDTGHLPWLEQPRAVADQIRGFLVQHQASNQ